MNSSPTLRRARVAAVCLSTLIVCSAFCRGAVAQQRALGVDISYWNTGSAGGNGITQANWNTGYSVGNRQFAFIRATRGGTTGVDQIQGTPGGGSQATLSRRYDDPRFIQNINRATNAGMLAGPYHYGRPDVAGNTGTDEANHFIQMAGAWMRPGYLIPVFDLEEGDAAAGSALAQFSLDFSDRLYEVMRIRPAIYLSGVYSDALQGASRSQRNELAQPASNGPTMTGPAFPMLWDARYAYQGNENAPGIQSANPKDSASTFYGPWDDYGDDHPWDFWQYSSTSSIPGFNSVDSGIDSNVSHGDIEYVRNLLVPAVWWDDASGDWSTLANWNSGQPPIVPIHAPGQAAPYESGPLPTARLPGAAGSGPTSGQYDTVILERPMADVTVTHSTGTHNIRKLYVRETLEITGGSLTVNYNPEYRPDNSATVRHAGPISAQFSGAVSLSGSGSLDVHTLQVDATHSFTLAGGTLAFDTINLMPHASDPATIAITGPVNINPRNNETATIGNGAGSGNSGRVELAGGSVNVGNGTADVDLAIDVPILGGALTKSGAGTMRLGAPNSYTGQTTVNGGILRVTANNQLGPSGVATGQAGTLQLSGSNLSYSLPLTIGGGGASGVSLAAPGNPGALDNLNGDNTWFGPITLAGTGSGGIDPAMNQIGAQAGSLRLHGLLQNDGATNATWGKTGNGDVILSGPSANTYSGLTRLSGGRLIIEKDGGLGAAGSASTADGNTFQLAGSSSTLAFRAAEGSGGLDYSTFEVINTHGTAAPGLGQVDNLGGDNTFAGQIAFDGPDAGGVRLASIGVSSGSLHVTGGLYARGSDGAPRQITKRGTGRLILSGDGGATTGNPLVVPLINSVFNVEAGTVELRGPSPSTPNLPGVSTWTVHDGGALELASGAFAATKVNVSAGGEFKLIGGTATVGTLNLTGGGTVQVDGGTLQVNSVQGSLTNQAGTLAPGSSAGLAFVMGNYEQHPGATLQIEIGGAPGSGQHDVLGVSGVATIGGMLEVSLINGFVPAAGQQFTVLGAGTIVDNGLTLGGSAAGLFNMIVGSSSVILEALSTALPGDFNDDGLVDAADYVIWRKTSSEPGGYTDWQANFGRTQGSGAAGAALGSVPEPTSLALVALAGGLLSLARRRVV